MRHARKDYDRIQDPAGLIPQDEPVFLLRGQDVLAPDTLRYWADRLRIADIGEMNEMSKLAEDQAIKMELWQQNHKKKFPDLPEAKPEINSPSFEDGV
jgi:hypothetical protein